VLYGLSHTSSLFSSGCLWDGVSWTICPGWPPTLICQISASQEARITGISHLHLAVSILHLHVISWISHLRNLPVFIFQTFYEFISAIMFFHFYELLLFTDYSFPTFYCAKMYLTYNLLS
jgi:hypothetical protein